jgi:hypothetical protein
LEKLPITVLATWNAFRVPPTQSDHIDLSRAKSIAREVAGNRDDRFRFIQFPLNMAMPEALLSPTQMLEGEQISTMEAADRLGIAAIASKSICKHRLSVRFQKTLLLPLAIACGRIANGHSSILAAPLVF